MYQDAANQAAMTATRPADNFVDGPSNIAR
jgi:hypothetical protein